MFEALTLDDLVIRSSSHTPFFGVYLASHAILDALCMCHASVGCKVKTEQHLKDHDHVQDAHNRRRYSQFVDEDLINGSTAQLEEEIVAWHRRQNPGLIVIDSSTPISLQAAPLAGVIERMEAATGAHVIHVDARNYDQDLYAGYARTIGAILRRQDWEGASKQADEVSILGHLFDRYEPDQTGNAGELRRLLYRLGFKARSVFFCGERYADLKSVVNASAHVVLPYASSQSKWLTERGERVIETGLPMSLAGTRRWISEIGRQLHVERRAQALLEQEIERVKPLMELARRALDGRTFGVLSDAPRAAGVMATLMEAGMKPLFAATLHLSPGGRSRVEQDLERIYEITPPSDMIWVENPTPEQVRLASLDACDVIIGPTAERESWSRDRPAWVEFGFPSANRHFLFPAPHLGFNGALRLIEQVMHAVESGGGRRALPTRS